MDLINLQPNLYRTQVNLGSNLWVRVGGALQQPVEAMGEGSTDARDGAAGDPHTGHPQEALEGDKRAEGSMQQKDKLSTAWLLALPGAQSHLPHIQGGHGHGAVRPFQPAG